MVREKGRSSESYIFNSQFETFKPVPITRKEWNHYKSKADKSVRVERMNHLSVSETHNTGGGAPTFGMMSFISLIMLE